MPKYLIEINTDGSPDREEGVRKVTDDYNAALQPITPPLTDPPTPPEPVVPLTVEQYLQRVLDIAVDSYAQSALKAQTNIIAVKFEKADPTKRQEVLDSLSAIDIGAGGGLDAVVNNIKPIV